MFPAVLIIPAVVGWLRWQAEQQAAGPGDGPLLFVVANIVILSAFVWWNAASLERMDRDRRRAERRLGVQYAATPVLAESPRLEDAVPRGLAGDLRRPGLDGGRDVVGRPPGRPVRCGDIWHAPSSRVEEFAA